MVFPEPVGPVTKIMPLGFFKLDSNCFKDLESIPSCSSCNCVSALSNILNTTFSPWLEGKVDTLISIHFSPNLRDIRPSCGTLFSAMSRLDITLIRALNMGAILSVGLKTSVNIPSTRNLTET